MTEEPLVMIFLNAMLARAAMRNPTGTVRGGKYQLHCGGRGRQYTRVMISESVVCSLSIEADFALRTATFGKGEEEKGS
jgi:hypothetical protein